MGSYASVANTRKDVSEGVVGPLAFGVAEMQGWRKTMEDTHIVARVRDPPTHVPHAAGGAADAAEDSDDVYVFGVFDGHGGREVAHFCKLHFAETLPTLPSWRARAFAPLLREAFLAMDEMLLEPRYYAELGALRGTPPPAPGGASGADRGRVDALVRNIESSAIIPIDDTAQRLRAVLALQKPLGGAGGMASSPVAGSTDTAEGAPASAAEAAGGGAGGALAPAERSRPPPARYDPLGHVQAGCTAIVACVHRRTLHVANAGDSRAVLSRGGETVVLSVDHKPAHPTEYERITKAGGWVSDAGRVNGNLNLSRSIGDLRYKRNEALEPDEQVITAAPDVRSIELQADDEFCVLACDGIWDVKTSEQVVHFVRARLQRADAAVVARAAAPPGADSADGAGVVGGHGGAGARAPLLSAIAEELFDECISRNPAETAGIGADNMTCLIVDLRAHCAPRVGGT
ncbi:hypothetical protein KFE25_003668 [Diacronema lutheri]|uniref:PPM-type phosphatase domain-containing protein n=3 Tax=Diacronema lutheri TaxID=2081491 RepID=A0A8J5XBK1_DIALT|nr:hypothetical protein KFE25_003668 [Diacronema lutheri]